jgi:hypothetical protein
MRSRCTKCGVRPPDPKYTIDRDTAFCHECATLLRLGTSREALKMEQGIPRSSIVEDDHEEEINETL